MRLPERREIEEGLDEIAAEQAEYLDEVRRDLDQDFLLSIFNEELRQEDALHDKPCSHDSCPMGWCNVYNTSESMNQFDFEIEIDEPSARWDHVDDYWYDP